MLMELRAFVPLGAGQIEIRYVAKRWIDMDHVLCILGQPNLNSGGEELTDLTVRPQQVVLLSKHPGVPLYDLVELTPLLHPLCGAAVEQHIKFVKKSEPVDKQVRDRDYRAQGSAPKK